MATNATTESSRGRAIAGVRVGRGHFRNEGVGEARDPAVQGAVGPLVVVVVSESVEHMRVP